MKPEIIVAIVGTSISAVALILTGILAYVSVAEQRKLASNSVAEQRRASQADRRWRERSALYVDLLVWLDERSRTVVDLREVIEQRRHEEDMDATRRLFARLEAAIEHRSESALDDDSDDPSENAQPNDIVAVFDHFEPPLPMRVRLTLFASERVTNAFENYKASKALPLIGDDVESWIEALELAEKADDKFRDAILEEVKQYTGTE